MDKGRPFPFHYCPAGFFARLQGWLAECYYCPVSCNLLITEGISNARSAINIDIVNPIPPRSPAPAILLHFISDGREEIPSAAATNENSKYSKRFSDNQTCQNSQTIWLTESVHPITGNRDRSICQGK